MSEPISDTQIVPGIVISAQGQATIDPSLADVLFDLALQLEGPTSLPVDVQHVLAALVLASRGGELIPEKPLSSHDSTLVSMLVPHIRTVFADYGGRVGADD